ncbi:MAG TPA: IS21-like element helper ATPase IstB [Thermoleophilaceae bacterium]|jgi:DNA replication protein DnaC
MSDELLERLRRIGLRVAREALDALLLHATKSRLSPTEFAEQLVALELRERETRNLARRTKLATLGTVPPLDHFDWNHPRAIDRDLYEQLLALDFLREGHNVLVRGQSGVGKTMLAQNLALQAIGKGFTVSFSTLGAALADLLKQESLPAVERRLRRYTAPDLLVLDEIGYLPCDSRSADLLYNIISRRHEKKSTVVTTNLAFKQWNTIFPGAACVVALVDRFAQHCHVLDIDADSWRQKNSLKTPADSAKRTR